MCGLLQHLWDIKGVRHPFDVVACMLKGGPGTVVSDFLQTFPQFNASLADEFGNGSDGNASIVDNDIGGRMFKYFYSQFSKETLPSNRHGKKLHKLIQIF